MVNSRRAFMRLGRTLSREQLIAGAVLTPADRFVVGVNENAVRMTLLQQCSPRVVVCTLTSARVRNACRDGRGACWNAMHQQKSQPWPRENRRSKSGQVCRVSSCVWYTPSST